MSNMGFTYPLNSISKIAQVDPENLPEDTESSEAFYYIDIGSVKPGSISTELDLIAFGKAPSRARRVIRENDILMSTVRPNLKSFAKADHIMSKTVASTGFAVIRVLEGNDADFIYQNLFSDYFLSQIECLVVGSNYPAINSSEVRGLLIPTPDFNTQQKIAKILTTVDNLIEKTQALIDKYTAIKQGMMADLFTRGVDLSGTPDTNPNYGQLRPSYEQAPELYKETELGWVPKEWEVLTFDEMLRRGDILGIQDGNHGEIHPKSSDFIKEGIPFVMANNLNDGRIEFSGCHHISEEQYNSLRIGFSEPGDVLLSHKGTVGRVAIVGEKDGSVMLTPQVTYYRFYKKGSVNNKYIFYYFQSPRYQSLFEMLSEQSTRKYIGITEQRKFLAPVPGIEEQNKLVEQIDKISSLIRSQVQTFSRYKYVKKGLMQDLLTGAVQVMV